MANTNPSGPNQALSAHPLSSHQGSVLGSDVVALAGLVAGTIKLLDAPPSGVVRTVFGRSLVSLKAGTVALTDVFVFVKDSAGRERVVYFDAVGPLAGVIDFLDIPTQLLSEDDDGVYLRFTAAAGVGTSIALAFNDGRGLTRTDTELTSIAPTVISPSVPAGGVLKVGLAEDGDGNLLPALGAFNFTVGALTVVFDLFDGTNAFPLAEVVAPLGTALNVTSGLTPAASMGELTIPPGYSLRATLSAPPVGAPVVMALVTRNSNQSPVRADQGGSY